MWLLQGKTVKEISTYFFRPGFKKTIVSVLQVKLDFRLNFFKLG